jgi:mannose-6-phosphate isomerase-like protein (cupin superfamily)
LQEQETRPWGGFHILAKNRKSTVKILRVNKLSKTSLQYHRGRDELWRVLNGLVLATVNGVSTQLSKDDEIYVKAGEKHRIEGITDSEILEIAFGDFDENDIIRVEDDYNRVKTL